MPITAQGWVPNGTYSERYYSDKDDLQIFTRNKDVDVNFPINTRAITLLGPQTLQTFTTVFNLETASLMADLQSLRLVSDAANN